LKKRPRSPSPQKRPLDPTPIPLQEPDPKHFKIAPLRSQRLRRPRGATPPSIRQDLNTSVPLSASENLELHSTDRVAPDDAHDPTFDVAETAMAEASQCLRSPEVIAGRLPQNPNTTVTPSAGEHFGLAVKRPTEIASPDGIVNDNDVDTVTLGFTDKVGRALDVGTETPRAEASQCLPSPKVSLPSPPFSAAHPVRAISL
jgi:hypothetical protein